MIYLNTRFLLSQLQFYGYGYLILRFSSTLHLLHIFQYSSLFVDIVLFLLIVLLITIWILVLFFYFWRIIDSSTKRCSLGICIWLWILKEEILVDQSEIILGFTLHSLLALINRAFKLKLIGHKIYFVDFIS